MTEPPYVVGIVVDPSFGDRLHEILGRMPVWVAATDANHRTAERVWLAHPGVAFTEPGGLTTFRVDPTGTPEDWLADVRDDVAGHHDRYSHAPGYSAVEVFGVSATPRLRVLLASYRLTLVSPRPDGFIAANQWAPPPVGAFSWYLRSHEACSTASLRRALGRQGPWVRSRGFRRESRCSSVTTPTRRTSIAAKRSRQSQDTAISSAGCFPHNSLIRS